MLCSNKVVLVSAQAQTASTTGDSYSLPPGANGFIAYLKATSIHADTTLDAKIQHSPDGSNWFDLVSFTQQTGTSGFEIKQVTDNVLINLRAVTTLAGTTTAATLSIEVYFQE